MKNSNKNILLLFILCFVLGFAGLFVFGLQLLGYIFAHIGALGLLGFLGIGTAHLASKKGYNKKIAFNLGFSVAIFAGIIASVIAFLFGDNNRLVCGGAASLIASFIVLSIYLLLKPKSDLQK